MGRINRRKQKCRRRGALPRFMRMPGACVFIENVNGCVTVRCCSRRLSRDAVQRAARRGMFCAGHAYVCMQCMCLGSDMRRRGVSGTGDVLSIQRRVGVR